ncbi:Organic cation transporter protein [Pseudolycoriella hygida]|uniref:Organic cation transporter protein n=1 Tax=Pseudolycoriella hygida TaxID=35572 RepID=A0A9Q0MQI2_9DIPT|nr:Organic cation transporter protein [Pseudolycoriella hygida]
MIFPDFAQQYNE